MAMLRRSSSARSRVVIVAALALIAALVLVPDTRTAAGPSAGQPGGTLVVGYSRRIDSLDPNVWTSRYDRFWMTQFYDPLIWQTAPGEYRAGLARAWRPNENLTRFRLTLRDDIRLHDGTPFDAELLVWTVKRILDKATGSYKTGLFNDMVRNQAVEKYVWEIEFSKPQYRFMETLSTLDLSPNSPKAIDKHGKNYPRWVVSTGPYMIDSWPDENTLVLKRNPNWKRSPWMDASWGPFLDQVTIRIIPERSTRLVALERGEVQMIFEPPFQNVPKLKTGGQFQVQQHFTAGLPQGLNINVSKPPTNDLALRRAMFFAVNRDEINRLAFFGMHRAAYSVLASASWAYWPGAKAMYPFDPQKARKTLEEAGWVRNPQTRFYEKGGQKSLVRIVTTPGREYEIPAQRLREAGIEAKYEAMAYEATETRYDANTYEVARLGLSGFDPAFAMRGAFHSSNVNRGNRFNRTKIIDPKIDGMLERAEAMFDINQRKAIYEEFQKYVMEQALYLPLWEDSYVWIVTSRFRGFEFDILGDPMLHKAWLQR
ncbi:MAG: hypothetical protein HY660_15820 [Armatimonadetes bacterium]|nr:hypothetical protein [Armatimonadota bacterium]